MIAKKLILTSVERITFKDKETRSPVSKFKYLFLKPDGTYLVAYDEIGFYKDDVVDQLQGWDESKAKHYPFELKEFNGQVREKLFSGKVDVDNPEKK